MTIPQLSDELKFLMFLKSWKALVLPGVAFCLSLAQPVFASQTGSKSNDHSGPPSKHKIPSHTVSMELFVRNGQLVSSPPYLPPVGSRWVDYRYDVPVDASGNPTVDLSKFKMGEDERRRRQWRQEQDRADPEASSAFQSRRKQIGIDRRVVRLHQVQARQEAIHRTRQSLYIPGAP